MVSLATSAGEEFGQGRRGPQLRPARVALHALVGLLCFLTIFPFFWMLSTSVKIPTEIFTKDIRILPTAPTLANFPDAFAFFPVANWFWNSFFIATMTTLGKIAVSVPAAFAFARLQFRGSSVLFAAVLGTMIVPGVVTFVPNYVLVSDLGWINTPWGVIIPSIAPTAFSVFLLRQYIRTLPQEILDAARIDGAGTGQILLHIVLPNIKPAIAVVTILAFLASWNQYTWPLLVLNDLESKTLAVGMQFFSTNTESAQLWGPMMATATLATLPPLIIYALAQKQIISTFVTSGMKG
ncbi:MAG: carbohydrate ABC transporter permease [Thermomicrobiales bacterium]